MKKILSLSLILFVFAGGLTAQNPKIVKILTFNIYHGETMKGDYDLDYIAGVISKLDPDLVALQEVDFKTNRSKKYDLASELGIRTHMAPLFGRAMYYSGGAYGVGILSKYGFEKTENHPLPVDEGKEPRTALSADVKMPFGDVITFISTHLSVENEESRLLQVNAINQLSEQLKTRVILAGDLNDAPESIVIQRLKKNWGMSLTDLAPTCPSSLPEKKIDYIMFQPERQWKVIRSEVIIDKIASDHCALYTELQLLDK